MLDEFEADRILTALVDAEVAFVVIGGLAAVMQGSAYITRDLDLCYQRTPQNVDRLCAALRPLEPRLRGAPADLPFVFDAQDRARRAQFHLGHPVRACRSTGRYRWPRRVRSRS